jgi:RNA polymerase sigma factor (sigma-70 family)
MNDRPDKSVRRLDDLARADAFVARLAASLIDDPGAADDVAQDALFAAWKSPPDDPERARGYWARIVARLAANRRRGDARRDRHERAAARSEVGAARDVAEREEARRRLWEVVEGLEPALRDVVRLRYFDGRASGDVAAALGLPVDRVYALQRRALARMRAALDRSAGGRDAWIAWALPLARCGDGSGASVGAAVGGGMLMAAKAKSAAVAAAAVIALAWWGAGGGFGSAADRRDGAAVGADGGTPAFAATASRPRVDGAADSRAVASEAFADPDADRATFVLVRERDRAPVADAETALVRPGGAKDLARTDAAGVVRFGASRGKGQLAVRTASRPTSVFDVGLGVGRTEIVLAEGLTLRGRVTVDGKPPGEPIALVVSNLWGEGDAAFRSTFVARVWSHLDDAFARTVVVDVDGRFEITGISSRWSDRLVVRSASEALEIEPAAQRASRLAEHASLTPDGSEQVIRLRRRATLYGRIRDWDGGRPPSEAAVTVVNYVAVLGGSSGAIKHVAHDAEGAFEFFVPSGFDVEAARLIEVVVRPGPGAPPTVFTLGGPIGARRNVGDLLLPKLRAVVVDVRDASGAPVAGAEVCDSEAVGERAAVTAADGSATLRLPLEDRTLRVTATGYDVSETDCRAGATSVRVALHRGGRVEFRLRDVAGRPWPHFPVRVTRPQRAPKRIRSSNDGIERGGGGYAGPASIPGRELWRLTADREGVVALRGGSAGDEIVLEATGVPGLRSVKIDADRTEVVDVVVPGDRHEFAVRLRDEDGRPVDGSVRFGPVGGPADWGVSDLDVDGAIRLKDAPFHTAHATVSAPQAFVATTVAMTATDGGEPTTIVLRRARLLHFRVVDAAGEPALRAHVQLDRDGHLTYPTRTGAPAAFAAQATDPPSVVVVAAVGAAKVRQTLALVDDVQTIVVPSSGVAQVVVAGPPGEAWLRLVLLDGSTTTEAPLTLVEDVGSPRSEATIEAVVGRHRLEMLRSRLDPTPVVPPVEIEIRRNETTRVELRAP